MYADSNSFERSFTWHIKEDYRLKTNSQHNIFLMQPGKMNQELQHRGIENKFNPCSSTNCIKMRYIITQEQAKNLIE